jgi:hypothetical protein
MAMLKPIKIFALICVCLFILYSCLAIGLNFNRTTPDENSRLFFLKQAAINKSYDFSYSEKSNKTYSTNLIRPRNSVISPTTDRVVPSDFLGENFYLLPSYILIKNISIWLLIFPLFAVLLIFAAFKLVAILESYRAGVIAALIIGLLPIVTYWGYRPMTDIPSLALLLLGISYYIEGIKNKNALTIQRYVLTGMLLGVGLSFRYTNALLVFAFFIAFINYKKLFIKKYITHHIALFVSLLLTFSPIFMLNYNLYGNVFTTGQSIYSGSSTSIQTRTINIFSHLGSYFVSFMGLLVLFGFLGLFMQLKKNNRSIIRNRFAVWVILFICLNVFLYSRADVFGASSNSVLLSYSLVRYYLGIYVLLACYMALYINKIGKIKYFIIILFSSVSIFQSLYYKNSGLIAYHNEIKASKILQQDILRNTPRDSYIFTRTYDKFLFPDRKIVSYYNSGIDPIPVRLKNTADLAKKLSESNVQVYFLRESIDAATAKERRYESFEQDQESFGQEHLKLEPINSVIYRVVQQ